MIKKWVCAEKRLITYAETIEAAIEQMKFNLSSRNESENDVIVIEDTVTEIDEANIAKGWLSVYTPFPI